MRKNLVRSVINFDEPGATDAAVVGGKGANLAILSQAGIPVPAGFCITASAYRGAIESAGLPGAIDAIFRTLGEGDNAQYEAATAQIRGLVEAVPLTDDFVAAVRAAYCALGDEPYVAVRSSGTAEDSAHASFAGLHETYLDMKGIDAVLNAVKQCWASLWTGRAAAYRANHHIDDSDLAIAVVVQVMVTAEVSGVMFTANPMTTNTDEIVINASWGLGEAVVQGIVTPDEFVVRARRPAAVGYYDSSLINTKDARVFDVRQSTIGSKAVKIVRAPAGGVGTVEMPVTAEDQTVASLTPTQVIELCRLGKRIEAVYDRMPQDIEWAFADGRFQIVQSRPITGVHFDWAADMETFQWAPDDDTIWTSSLGQHITGAKCPLYYHWVTDIDSIGGYTVGNVLGIPELMGPSFTNGGADINRPAKLQVHKYYRAELYHSTEFEKITYERFCLPWIRTPEVSALMTPEQAQELHKAKFKYVDFVRTVAQMALVHSEFTPWKLLTTVQHWIDRSASLSNVASFANLTEFSDEDLKRNLEEQWAIAPRFAGVYGFFMIAVWAPQMFSLLERLLSSWYRGTNENAFAELCSGDGTRSKTLEENFALYEMSEVIRASQELTKLFAVHQDGAFFTAAENSPAGQAFSTLYREFVRVHGHCGSEERDLAYPRRFEDPSLDYQSLRVLLSAAASDSPLKREEQQTERHRKVLDEVVNSIRGDSFFGSMKVEALKAVYRWVQDFRRLRDDARWAYEHSGSCLKLLCREIGKRCVKRGFLDDAEDFTMFTKLELYEIWQGRASRALTKAKAKSRRRDYEAYLNGSAKHPAYIRDGREIAISSEAAENTLSNGKGWTSGIVTATARVVDRLSEIDRVKPGDILVCYGTDPGWTPVFMILSGIVTETGGVLSHSTCLSREYGLPSVQLPGARKLIPDGARISVNGATGEIVILSETEPLAA